MARFRFKAVAPSSEVVEGELEANDRQSAIGRLRELNHLPVRVEEMREGALRRREQPERIEPQLAELPRIDADRGAAGRVEPKLVPPPAEPKSAEAPQPLRSPIVRLREVLRGVVSPVRHHEPIVAPPAAPETSPSPELGHPAEQVVPPPEPESPQPALHQPEPAIEEAVAPEAAIEEPPVEQHTVDEPPAVAEPLPSGLRLEPAPAEDEAAQPQPEPAAEPETQDEPVAEAPRLHVIAREDAAVPLPEVARIEPLPMRWDTTPSETAPPDAEVESSADRWLREVEQAAEPPPLDHAVDQLAYPPEPPIEAPAEQPVESLGEPLPEPPEPIEPALENASRAVVPAAVVLPPPARRDLAPARDREPAAEPAAAPAREPRRKKKPKAKRARRALPARLLPVFTRELQVLLSAGLPMDQALRIIVESTADDRVAAAADALLARVRGGALLSEAMEALPEQFDEFLRTAVRAGEAGGSLADVLGQVAQYQERGQALERSVKTAMIYPTILAFAAALSVTLLLTLVVPQFEALLRQSAQAPPLATRFVIGASVFVRAYGWIVPAAGLVLCLLVRWRLAGLRGRARMHARLLRLPMIGKVIAGVAVERLARALGTLLANGVALPEALPLVANAIPNRAIGAVVASAAERVKQGERLADALEDGRVLPSLAVQLIRVGEEGGRLSEMLARVAEIYAGDVDVAVRRVTAVVEPALILAIGIIVGGIVLSLLAAITGLNTLAL